MRRIALFGCTFVLFLIVSLFLLKDDATREKVPRPIQQQARRIRNHLRRKGSFRIAVVIPFVGKSVPPYLDLFCAAAQGSAPLVDFLLIHNGALEQFALQQESMYKTNNVRFINLGSTLAIARKFMRVLDRRELDVALESTDFLAQIITKHIEKFPYVLVEFKPALGHIFAEYLEGYTHWAYSDLDIAFGDLPRWVTESELRDFDIVSYGYGDQGRVYLRGQFTFHKNRERVNQIWRECDYLSHLDMRFANALAEKDKLHFESAEGCYSTVVLQQNDIRVKYAVKAMTDIEQKDSANQHGVFIGIGHNRDRSVIYKAAAAGRPLLDLSPTWFESHGYANSNATDLQQEMGRKQPIDMTPDPDANCMYWVQKKYQPELCLKGAESTDTVFFINGQLYKQPFQMAELPDGIVTAPFFHFQEWKRFYRQTQLSSISRLGDALTWVLTKEGAIPFGFQEENPTRLPSPLGQPISRWGISSHVDRKRLPGQSYCLRSGPKRFPPIPAPACETVVSWQDSSTTEILHFSRSWNQVHVEKDVTLALTIQITAKQGADRKALLSLLDVAVSNVRAWQGQPCVVVVHIAGVLDEASLSIVRVHLGYLDHDACLVALVADPRTGYVSRKALMNMASDAAPTRWVISGVEVERGLILSKESAFFAHRQAQIAKDHRGSVFVVPQFALHDDGNLDAPVSLTELLQIKRDQNPIRDPSDFEVGSCDDDQESNNNLFLPVYKLWWQLTTLEVGGVVQEEAVLGEVAATLNDLEESFAKLLTREKHFDLFSADPSPILMVDNKGPSVRTSDLVREVEEFAGKLCYNVLRLAQLATLGYYIHTLSGAFAVSTTNSRHATLTHMNEDTFGASRCDGCFMFDDENEKILEHISLDEQTRPAKTAILWHGKTTL